LNLPPKRGLPEHSKVRGTAGGQRRLPASVARRARREAEEEDNDDACFRSDSENQTPTGRVADSYGDLDIRTLGCTGNQRTENFFFVLGSREKSDGRSALG
ncbi:MAG: hypothetical protein WAN14_08190, partial [Candidatus Acidiferrales bacterium]